VTHPRSKYSPSTAIEEKKKRAVPSSANIIRMCPFSVSGRRERERKGEERDGWGTTKL